MWQVQEPQVLLNFVPEEALEDPQEGL